MTRKPNFVKCILGVIVLALLFIGTWATTHAPRSTAQEQQQGKVPTINAPPTPTPTPPGPPLAVQHLFEIEGNVCNDSAEGNDWNDINPSTDPACDPGFVTGDPDGTGPIQLATFVIDTCPDDRVFRIGSSKDFQDIEGNWHSDIGSVPDKDEITHAYAAIGSVPSTPTTIADGTAGHRVLVFGGDRFATNGDANIGFWFFQSAVSVDTVTGDFHGNHVNGDLFIVSAFTGGGGTSVIDVYEWVGTPLSGAATACSNLGGVLDNAGTLCKLPATAGKGTGIVNPADLSGACPGGGGFDWPYSFKGEKTPCTSGPCTAQKGSFYEGGVDLSALGFAGTCFSTFLLETRSSQTVDAILKDFALGSFDTCALTVSKTPTTQEFCAGGSATYNYSVTNSGVSTLFVTVVDDSGTPNNTADDYDAVTGVLVSADPGGVPVEIQMVGGQTAGSCSDPNPTSPCLTHRIKQFLTVPNPNPEINTVTAKGRLISGGTIVKTATATASTTVNPNPTCSVSPSSAEVCAGGSATFTVTPSGGTAPYTFLWNTGETTQSITKSAAGTYTVTVTDSKGCTTTCSGTLIVNPNPTCSVSPASAEICSGGSQQFTANPSGGTAPYTFLWSSGETTQSITKSAAGTYTVTITDSKGCTTSCSGSLVVNPNPTVSINSVACDLDGSIVLHSVPSGGTGPYTFLWSTGATTQDITVTAAGTYSVTVTDSKGCVSAQASIRVGLCAGP